MPLDPSEIPGMGPDIAELVAVFFTIAVSMAILIGLGRWWAN
jgi:hypothetical protein